MGRPPPLLNKKVGRFKKIIKKGIELKMCSVFLALTGKWQGSDIIMFSHKRIGVLCKSL
jgi:hypothetical protein